MNDSETDSPPATETQLVPRSERGISVHGFDDMMKLATAVVNSKLAPKGLETPEAVLVAMQHGMELGLSPMQAVQSIAVINGRPSIYGDTALALVKSHPDCLDVVETFERGDTEDKTLGKCVVHRRDLPEVTRTFSVAQAKKAGLWGKAGPWTNYPERMLRMRARGFALRDSFPQCLKGVGIREETQDIEPRTAQARVVEPAMVMPGDAPPALTDKEPELPDDPPAGTPADQDLVFGEERPF